MGGVAKEHAKKTFGGVGFPWWDGEWMVDGQEVVGVVVFVRLRDVDNRTIKQDRWVRNPEE